MQAGQLRHRVTIQTAGTSDTLDSYGQPTLTWTTHATRWARITPLSGRELFNAAQIQPDVTHQVELRHTDGVTTKMRLLFGTRVLHIRAIRNPDERGRNLILDCAELV